MLNRNFREICGLLAYCKKQARGYVHSKIVATFSRAALITAEDE